MTKEQEKLVAGCIGYVVTLARQYQSDILSTDDMVSEGCIGLMKAAEKYDASKGKPFVTYAAPFIRRSIEDAINKLTVEVETRSTDESIPVGSRNNYTLLNVLEEHDAPKADAIVEQETLSHDLLKGFVVLDGREQQVIRYYYGIDSVRMTMAEIATMMRLKRERVRQIRDKALRKLKKARKVEE